MAPRDFEGPARAGAKESVEAVFTEIHEKNLWQDAESRSGTGSNLNVTRAFASDLAKLLRHLRIKSMLDIPCGDFNWMRGVDLEGIDYTGADIVEAVARRNQEIHAGPGRRFLKLDLIRDPLPRTDLVFCRDCLVHLRLADILSALDNIRRSGAKYLLTTTFPTAPSNPDIQTGQWRRLNLRLPPFDLPEPLAVIVEECPEAGGVFVDKSLGLWRTRNLSGAQRP